MNSSRQEIVKSLKLKIKSSKLKAVCCLLFAVYCLLLIGCSGAQTQTLSAVNLRAIEYNQNAAKAVEKGDYEKALAYYMEALKINRSIENTEGIAVNLINIAVLYQKKGNPSNAHEFVDIAFSMPDISNEIRSDAAYEKARIYLKEKNAAKAKEWVNKSLSVDKGLREGSRWNLMGRISFAEGKYDEAAAMANTALNLNRENKQRAEESNSLRLMAEINAQKGLYWESRELYKKSLEIDKELGDSKKIATTLRGIGMLSLKQGHFQDAAIFYLRAYDVSSNAGDTEGTSEALDSLSDAYRKSDDDKKAEEILKKKANLEKEKKK
ncbi:MAG: tetratricopeptide repeat protein [Nitrospirae bacterium]|nr:tetratricopeptide repeat protein [Nitrospirota bacterium]MBI3376961.1 tetratricopeptide repeat protein [Nitrospirota bacterium]